MTCKELAMLPVGTIVKIDDEEGEIIQAGQVVHIIWPQSGVTRIVHTQSKAEETFAGWLEVE